MRVCERQDDILCNPSLSLLGTVHNKQTAKFSPTANFVFEKHSPQKVVDFRNGQQQNNDPIVESTLCTLFSTLNFLFVSG